VDLLPENLEIWDLFIRFPSLIKAGFSGAYLNAEYAKWLVGQLEIDDPVEALEKMEAVIRGLTAKKR